ncbi:hypothetical protein [Caulobacter sp. Root655]|uniref:hypothetical protein n=1 Tax=Caulobacter sp. Root655 TaxID=1736578 RepID=UPI0012E38605|nr:hypothetical protein [Caulobacter sp. Root655]
MIDADHEGYALFDLAQCFLDGYDLSKLRKDMLSSDDVGIVSDGLFVAAEIGGLVVQCLPEIRPLAESPDPDIRKSAISLLSVYDKA